MTVGTNETGRVSQPKAGDSAYVEVDAVSFAYGGGHPEVISDVSLALRAGEFFVLLGPSGCGKTTVLNQVAGFEHPSSGRIRVDGAEVARPGPDRVVIFQGDDSLLGWLTVWQNVEFGLRVARMPKAERRQRVERALETVELTEQAGKYPHMLSGGMKQRVQIARALVTDAPVLLMDEPFGALDAQTRTSLQDELARIWESTRRTVLFITHDISEALILGDRVGVMTGGPQACVHSILDNDLPRPRHRGDERFAGLYAQLDAAVSDAKARRAGDRG